MKLLLTRPLASSVLATDTRQIMMHVLVALLPGILVYAVWLDFRVLPNLLAACVCATIAEALFLSLRKKAVLPALKDGSVVVAACLLTLCLPPSLPIWQLLLGVLLMVGLGKQVYGGLGQNPFNPAMVAYTVLLVSFPVSMTDWHLASVADPVQKTAPEPLTMAQAGSGVKQLGSKALTSQGSPSELQWDGVSGATALDRLRAIRLVESPSTIKAEFTNDYRSEARTLILGSPWVWLSAAWLLGGLYLLALRIISWHTPVSVLLSIGLLYTVADLAGFVTLPTTTALLSGAILFGAFFIATDPVTAPASRSGQLIFGAGIGILAFFIREYSAYPEGMAFAVLLMNISVPLIDHSLRGKHSDGTKPRVPRT